MENLEGNVVISVAPGSLGAESRDQALRLRNEAGARREAHGSQRNANAGRCKPAASPGSGLPLAPARETPPRECSELHTNKKTPRSSFLLKPEHSPDEQQAQLCTKRCTRVCVRTHALLYVRVKCNILMKGTEDRGCFLYLHFSPQSIRYEA